MNAFKCMKARIDAPVRAAREAERHGVDQMLFEPVEGLLLARSCPRVGLMRVSIGPAHQASCSPVAGLLSRRHQRDRASEATSDGRRREGAAPDRSPSTKVDDVLQRIRRSEAAVREEMSRGIVTSR